MKWVPSLIVETVNVYSLYVFALISTVFICWGFKFTWKSTMNVKYFHKKATNVHSEVNNKLGKTKHALQHENKYLFCAVLKLVTLLWKNVTSIVLFHIKLQDKNCRTESNKCTTSKNVPLQVFTLPDNIALI